MINCSLLAFSIYRKGKKKKFSHTGFNISKNGTVIEKIVTGSDEEFISLDSADLDSFISKMNIQTKSLFVDNNPFVKNSTDSLRDIKCFSIISVYNDPGIRPSIHLTLMNNHISERHRGYHLGLVFDTPGGSSGFSNNSFYESMARTIGNISCQELIPILGTTEDEVSSVVAMMQEVLEAKIGNNSQDVNLKFKFDKNTIQ